MNYDETANEKGYLLDVDIEYPRSLEKEHSELPFLALKGEKPTRNTKYSRSIQKQEKTMILFYLVQIKSYLLQ